MPDENVEQEVVNPDLAEAMEESAASEAQETEPVTQEQAETQEQKGDVPFHEHPRFKEIIDEKNWYKKQLEESYQRQQPPAQQTQQPQKPEYSNMTPDEERFWRAVDERAAIKAKEQFEKLNPTINAGLQEIASMKVQQFRASHPDIKADSPDEMAIAGRIKVGYNPEDAYWSVMGPRGVQRAKETAMKTVQQKNIQKKQANVERSPSVNSGKVAPQGSFRDTAGKYVDEYLKGL